MKTRLYSIASVFLHFLSLGLVSFGGPIAHIGYFQKAFVERLKWLTEAEFIKLTALCQLLPGPASSQLGFAIGLKKAGLAGAVAAFIGFTVPSFLIMATIAIYAPSENTWVSTVVAGLKLAAVVVVADACITMFSKFCNTPFRKGLAVATTLNVLLWPSVLTQIVILIIAALAGEKPPLKLKQRSISTGFIWRSGSAVALMAFVLVLAISPLLHLLGDWGKIWAAFYQSGSLVFGGGHVVLPLLQAQVGSLMPEDQFLLGYASAQGIPGPMFTFASFLGAEILTDNAWLGALIATLAIFAPGFLLVLAFIRSWEKYNENPALTAVFARVNAAVVGLLLAALVQPVLVSAVHGGIDTVIVVVGLLALRGFKLSILWLLLAMVAIALLRSLI